MSRKIVAQNSESVQEPVGINRITVAGYKSIESECSIDIRPLTILAGANSSGKSSIMQPLLLLKQTLEASYDPGPLLLDGANVKFTSAEQIFSRLSGAKQPRIFKVGLWDRSLKGFITEFVKPPKSKLVIRQMTYFDGQRRVLLQPEMTEDEIVSAILEYIGEQKLSVEQIKNLSPQIMQNRCFLELTFGLMSDKNMRLESEAGSSRTISDLAAYITIGALMFIPSSLVFSSAITNTIHLPGLRGNPERAYPVTGIGSTFAGTFEKYTASVIAQWQGERQVERLNALNRDLARLGLTSTVVAFPINDTQVELRVGRLVGSASAKSKDLVNITDVGLGVSQTLPMLVALQVAEPGQIVYLEQPEIHLHPRAQTAMAQVLADAAKRGVRVVAETHSSLLLLGIQTLVAEGKLAPELIKLHWFTRGANGVTIVQSADLDESGAFGDWPEDFADVELEAESRYLDAAAERQRVH